MEILVEIEDEKIKGFLMTGTVTFLKEEDGSYCTFPQDAEIVEYDLVDENDDPLDDDIENDDEVKQAILKRVIKINKKNDDDDGWNF